MASFLYKGVTSNAADFGILVTVLFATGLIHISSVCSVRNESESRFLLHYCRGFSGVIFALKTVLNFNSPTTSRVFGIDLPQTCSLELVVCSVFNPNASFLGHLSGILAGLMWLEFGEFCCVEMDSTFLNQLRTNTTTA